MQFSDTGPCSSRSTLQSPVAVPCHDSLLRPPVAVTYAVTPRCNNSLLQQAPCCSKPPVAHLRRQAAQRHLPQRAQQRQHRLRRQLTRPLVRLRHRPSEQRKLRRAAAARPLQLQLHQRPRPRRRPRRTTPNRRRTSNRRITAAGGGGWPRPEPRPRPGRRACTPGKARGRGRRQGRRLGGGRQAAGEGDAAVRRQGGA